MTYKENITAILECYFTGFKKEIIDSACNRILEQEPCKVSEYDKGTQYISLRRFLEAKSEEKTEDDILKAIHDNCYNRSQCLGCKYLNIDTIRCKLVGEPSDWEIE